MKAAYTPTAGSYAAKAVAHLQTLPPGTWLASGPLVEAIGIEKSSNLMGNLEGCLKWGWIKMRKDGHLRRWALGDGTPPASAKPEGEEADDETPLDPETPKPDLRLRSPFDLAKGDGINIDLVHGERLQGRPVPRHSAATPKAPASKTPPLTWAPAAPPPAAGWVAEPPPPPAPTPLPFGCALWDDHSLQLRLRDGRSVLLQREDFKVLLRFIQSASVVAA
jgi:hypothetical protein